MATADYWSGADLSSIQRGGLIAEDVMKKIYDISNVPFMFQDAIGTDDVHNSIASWTTDRLADVDLTNAVVDGQDNAKEDARGGARINNHCQISTKAVSVSTRARQSASIGRADELGYQVSRRQLELYRDMEGILLSGQGSQADDGDATPGLTAGLDAFISTNTILGTDGTRVGFIPGTGLVADAVPGTIKAIAESEIRDLTEQVFIAGGEVNCLMTVPQVISSISQYMFTDSARIATLQSDQGKSMEKAAALGAVNYFITDFGTLELKANRLQQPTDSALGAPGDSASVFLLDYSLIRKGILAGVRTEQLAKVGLADKRQMSCDYCLKVLNEEGLGVIGDISLTLPMLAVPA